MLPIVIGDGQNTVERLTSEVCNYGDHEIISLQFVAFL